MDDVKMTRFFQALEEHNVPVVYNGVDMEYCFEYEDNTYYVPLRIGERVRVDGPTHTWYETFIWTASDILSSLGVEDDFLFC